MPSVQGVVDIDFIYHKPAADSRSPGQPAIPIDEYKVRRLCINHIISE